MMRVRNILLLCLLVVGATAFCTPAQQPRVLQSKATRSATTALAERRWNFNEGQGPFGLKKNAEIWNGRVAQMAFVVVFGQELIQGKGVVQGVSEGDPINLVAAGLVAVTVVGLTGFLALKGEDDYVTRDME